MSEFNLKELKIEVTYNCPLACVHCSSNAGKDNKLTMTVEKCMQILVDAVGMGVESIAFSGGEPLSWLGLPAVIKYASSCNLHTTIYTSGNVDDPDKTFQVLKDCGLGKAIFSLYSPIEVEHNRITRVKRSYQYTLQSIDICRKIGIVPEIHFVALASNYHNLAGIALLARAHGIQRISVLRFVPQGRGVLISDLDTLSSAQNNELKRIIQRLRTEGHDIRTGSPFNVLWLNDDPKCMAGKDRLIVAPDTTIYPCDAFKQIQAESIAGSTAFSALDNHTLQDCWEKSEYLNNVRTAIAADPSPPCADCPAYYQCGSGCIAQKFLCYGTLYKNPDPACLR